MEDMEQRLRGFAKSHKLSILERIGFGIHGHVFLVEDDAFGAYTVLKAFESKRPYLRERDVYRRLEQKDVHSVCGCAVPAMLDCSDSLQVIWMTLVSRPFCLDFAAAYLDQLPPHHPPFDAEWKAEKREVFGDHWDQVCQVLTELETHGILQTDVNPGNISL